MSTFETDFYRELTSISPTPTPTLASYFSCLKIGYEKVADALMIIGTALNVRDMLFDEVLTRNVKVCGGGDVSVESLMHDKQLSKVRNKKKSDNWTFIIIIRIIDMNKMSVMRIMIT